MILVFGSINVDLLVPVPLLPQPGETVLGGDYALLPGGKGANQALAARRAGAAVALAGAVGTDSFADLALRSLRQGGVDLGLVRRTDRPTGCAAIMVGAQGDHRGENLIAVASGANRAAAATNVPDSVLGRDTILVCQMEVPAAENWALIRRARARGARAVLNLAPAAPVDPALFAEIDILVANEGEAATIGVDPEALAGRLRQALVVTRGAAGSTAFLADGGQIDVRALAIEPIDTTGAGDTFVGVLAAGLDRRLALAAALRQASAAAGLACLAHGAQAAMPDRAAIEAAALRLTTAAMPSSRLSDAEHAVQLRRAVVAGTVGTIIEAYDFLLYVQVAPLVFAKLFFPHSDPLVGTLEAFSIYAVGFISRPVGAALFGHFGDRVGRKVTLISTLLLTGLSTFAVGFVPGYDSIGVWGAVILTVVRFIQGMGIGGEWGGATLIAMEWAKTNKHRGFITSWPQWGGPAGLLFANLAVLIGSAVSGDQFFAWGWRIPFWISIVIVGIGIYIRLGILETPVFKRVVEEEKIARAPVLEVIRQQPGMIILTALCRMAEQAPFYVFVAFIFTYGTTVLHSSRNMLLTAVLFAAALSTISLPLSGHISDLIGRRRMYLIGAVTMGIFGFVYFTLLNTLIPAVIFIAILVSLIPHDMMYGCQAALIAECFPPRLRYSGASLGFHLSSVIAGGPAPLIATALYAATGTPYSIAIYILICAVVSVVTTLLLPDYTNQDISQEEAYGAEATAMAP